MGYAEVVDSAASGFTVKVTTNIHAAPPEVYRHLIHNVGDWWSPSHTFSQDAHNLSIDERVMGCFCEKLPGGGSVQHMEVMFLSPAKELRMVGALGPLQTAAATGVMKFTFSAVDGGTKLEVTYTVGGYLPQGMSSWAAPVDGVLTEQVLRLKNLC